MARSVGRMEHLPKVFAYDTFQSASVAVMSFALMVPFLIEIALKYFVGIPTHNLLFLLSTYSTSP